MKIPFACLIWLWTGSAAALPVSATRYIDAQGVEVIHNRNVEARAVPAPADSGRTEPAKPLAMLYDSKLRISPAEQDRRDRDRVGILQQELEAETRKYQELWQRAQTRRGMEKPNAAQAQRMTEELYEHQTNIKALNAELKRATAAR